MRKAFLRRNHNNVHTSENTSIVNCNNIVAINQEFALQLGGDDDDDMIVTS